MMCNFWKHSGQISKSLYLNNTFLEHYKSFITKRAEKYRYTNYVKYVDKTNGVLSFKMEW